MKLWCTVCILNCRHAPFFGEPIQWISNDCMDFKWKTTRFLLVEIFDFIRLGAWWSCSSVVSFPACRRQTIATSPKWRSIVPICSMGLEYLPTFTVYHQFKANVGIAIALDIWCMEYLGFMGFKWNFAESSQDMWGSPCEVPVVEPYVDHMWLGG